MRGVEAGGLKNPERLPDVIWSLLHAAGEECAAVGEQRESLVFGAVVDETEEREQTRPRTEAVRETFAPRAAAEAVADAFAARAAGSAGEVCEKSGEAVALVINGQAAREQFATFCEEAKHQPHDHAAGRHAGGRRRGGGARLSAKKQNPTRMATRRGARWVPAGVGGLGGTFGKEP